MLNRQKEFLQWIFAGVTTSALIVGVVYVSENREEVMTAAFGPSTTPTRMPSSIDGSNEKEKILSPTKTNGAPEGKGGGQMTIDVSSSTNDQGALVLTAEVHAMADLTDVKYEWLLPEGVTVAKGSVSGDLGTLQDGGTGEIETTFNISGSENKQIHLQVYRIVEGERMGQIAQYNTVQIKDADIVATALRFDTGATATEKPRRME